MFLGEVEQACEFLDLLLSTKLFEATAHLRAVPAGVSALGAGGLAVQGVGGIAQGVEQLRPLGLEIQVLLPDGGDLRPVGLHRLARSDQVGQLHHGAPQGPVQVPQLGLLLVEPLIQVPALALPALPAALQPGHGPLDNFRFKGHTGSAAFPLVF